MKTRSLLKTILPPAMVLIAAGMALEVFVRACHIPPYLLPTTTDVLKALVVNRQEFLLSLWTTAEAALLGFAASAVFGILLAIALSASPIVRRAFYPYTVFFQTVPIVAIAPLLIVWIGPGMSAVAVSAFIVSVFPVIANTLEGLLSTDPALVDLFHLYGAKPLARLFKLRLPAATPNIITGLRVAAGLAVIGTVVSEFLVGFLGSGTGLGSAMMAAKKNSDIDKLFALVLMTSLLGLGLFALVNLAGHLLLRRWHASER